jgi:NADH:ubiquinone oxidoreductase subunit 4 (subunit M)
MKIVSLTKFKDLNRKEFALFFILILLLFTMGLVPNLFLDTMYLDCLNILDHAKGNLKL